MPTLADIYSAINTFKRKSSDFVQNPGTSLEQMLFAANENAREFNKKHALATDYTIAQARGQQPTPEQTQAEMGLRNTLSEAYSPGMTVYHGSPYKFNQFNAAKIGSGEGNATYGIGHYVAESPNVAQSYLEQLKSKGYAKIVQKDRNAYDVVTPEGQVLTSNVMLGNAHRIKDAFDVNAGNLYKIDLPDEYIGKMLDWNKPLTKDAPQEIKEAFNNIVKNYPELKDKFFEGFKQSKPGNYYYSLLNDYAKTGDLVKNQEFASNVLQKAGITGIRYLDEGSRNVGKGTSNFVVFPGNENMLQMLERNQQPIK
jgi:hypothetical protein